MGKIALLGDIAFNGIVSSEPEKNEKRYNKICLKLHTLDLVIANFEIPVSSEERNEYKDFFQITDYNVTKYLLTKFNIKCLSLANNHIYDFKMSGLQKTINLLDELGIKHTGAGWKREHIEPVYVKNSGIKYGFIAYVDHKTNPDCEHFPELLINYFNIEKVKKDITDLKLKTDKIILSLHWGNDYSFYPTKEQILLSHELIDTGVNIIMGHHPHTIQPYEIYNNGYIFYSLGSLTFGDFIWQGKLRALKRKTKKTFVPIFDERKLLPNFITTKELKGNIIEITSMNIQKWSTRKLKIAFLSQCSIFIRLFIKLNESIIDHFVEFFFGYYRNPLINIFSLNNLKKLRFILRDLKK